MISTSHQNSNGNNQTPASPAQNQTSRQGTGVVTRILDDFGFIDDTIFFQLSVVRGSVKIGDKVYFECTYTKSLPFNWNATVVQPLSSGSSITNTTAPPNNPAVGPIQNLQQQQQQQATPAQQPPHHRPPPQMHQASTQQQQQPASSYQQQQPHPGNMYGAGHHHHQQQQQQPGGPPPPPGGYYQPQQQQRTQPGGGQPPPFNSSYHSGGGGAVPSPSMLQPGGRMAPPPQQQQPNAYGGANTQDLAKVQQAVAAAAQLAQYYPNANQQPQGPPAPGRNQQDHHHHPGGGPNNNQYGGPPPGQSGPLQYTSTPGSAFISSPFRPGGPQPNKPPGLNPQSGQGPPPWERPGDRPGGRPTDPRDRSRFNKPSRFSDPEPVLQQHRFPGPPANNEDRFGPPPQHPGGPGPYGPPSQQHDHFRGADMRRDEPPPPKFSMREKDIRHDREQQNRAAEREKERIERRERERRDQQARTSKRSISPTPSASSSTGASTPSRGPGLDFLPKRRLESCNIPKTSIIKNRYNALELKNRVSNSVSIPSDLKEVLYNVEADFDLFDIPKPIIYKIINEKDSKEKDAPKDASNKKSEEKDKKPINTEVKGKTGDAEKEDEKPNKSTEEETNKESSKPEEENINEKNSSEQETVTKNNENEKQTAVESVEEEEKKPVTVTSKEALEIDEDDTMMSQNTTNADTNTCVNGVSSSTKCNKILSHKYNVKVLLISLPSLAEIYERLFGTEFAGTSSFASGSGGGASSFSGKYQQVSHFHKLFSMLVSRNSSDGYSLIGGKYIKEMDGVIPGTDEPNLVATSIRIVWKQLKLNLSTCKQWRVISTFIYNRDNNLIPGECGYEIHKIYMPDIWSALENIYQPLNVGVDSLPATVLDKSAVKNEPSDDLDSDEMSKLKIDLDVNSTTVTSETETSNNQVGDGNKEQVIINGVPDGEKKTYLETVLENMANYKVYELKNELDKLGVKYESRCKKEQLFQLLQEMVQKLLKILNNCDDSGNTDLTIDKDNQLHDDDVVAASNEPIDINQSQASGDGDGQSAEPSGKRKLDSGDSVAAAATDESGVAEAKKPKLEESSEPTGEAKGDNEQKCSIPVRATGSEILVRGTKMSVVTLHAGLNPHRHDQFEFTIVSELLRDSLTIHFARYIYSAIIHNIRLQKPIVPAGQDRPRTTPVNYVHLAFSYFDKGHCGYMYSDDLNQLLQMTGNPVSRKTFASLVRSIMTLAGVTNAPASSSSVPNERIVYIFFEQPGELIPRQVDYPTISSGTTGTTDGPVLMVERNGIQYNVDELINQSVTDQKIKVQANDALVNATSRIAQLDQLVSELEAKQKKMSAATGRQNDELCAVKRERDQLKSKFEQMKRFWNKSINDFHSLMKTLDPPPAPSPAPTSGNTTANTETTNGQQAKPSSSSEEK